MGKCKGLAERLGDANRYIPEGLINGLKEAERIAKETGGHIPERVVDDGLLEIPECKQAITISLEKYEDLIRDAGYYQGRAEELEKQLEELKRIETITKYADGKPYIEQKIKRGEITE